MRGRDFQRVTDQPAAATGASEPLTSLDVHALGGGGGKGDGTKMGKRVIETGGLKVPITKNPVCAIF